MRVLVINAGIALVFLGGCSFMTSFDDLDDGAEPNEPATAKDGGVTSVDGSSTDASVDAGAGSSFCNAQTPAPRFCVDFDDGQVVTPDGARDFQFLNAGTTAAVPVVDQSVFEFAPPSLKIEAVTTDAVYVRRRFGDKPTKVAYSLAMRADSFSQYVDTMELRIGSPDLVLYMRLENGTDPVWYAARPVESPDTPQMFLSNTKVLPGGWHRYETVIDLATGKVEGNIDGTNVVSANVTLPASITSGVEFVAGYTEAHGPGTIWVDDVLADF